MCKIWLHTFIPQMLHFITCDKMRQLLKNFVSILTQKMCELYFDIFLVSDHLSSANDITEVFYTRNISIFLV